MGSPCLILLLISHIFRICTEQGQLKMRAVFVLMVVFAAFAYANALNCYTCVGMAGVAGCDEDDFGIETPCLTLNTCLKTRTEIGDNVLYTRSCFDDSLMPSGAKQNDCDTEKDGDTKVTACYCDSDLCNAATKNSMSVAAASIMMFLMMKYLW